MKKIISDQNMLIQQNTQNQIEIDDLKATIQEQSEQIAILANMQNDILNSNEQNNSRYEVTFSSINEELNQNKTNIRQQNKEINDLKNKSTRQNNKTKIDKNFKRVHNKLSIK